METPARLTGDRPLVSGVVICFNEESTIERCLRSLAWCDEIIVVDSHSTDRTREIARKYTPKVIEQEFLGHVEQKNFALDQASHDWVVSLDADEALSDELQREIPDALPSADGGLGGFRVNRMTYFLGVWHDHGEWYPDRGVRVFRRSQGRWAGLNPHDRAEVKGRVEELRGHILHWNYHDLSEHIQQIDKFTAILAREMRAAGRPFHLWDLLLRPVGRFLKGYVFRQGFRNGLPGFLVSISTAYYVFMKYAKLWELQRSERG
jgi:glycosyltransferase involved in cell wall biosynthesis